MGRFYFLDSDSKDKIGQRIDRYLAGVKELSLSRSYIQKLIKNQRVSVNNHPVKPDYRIQEGDSIHVVVPEPEPLYAIPEDIPIEILFEDDWVVVVNKPAGMVVHPAHGNPRGTLVNALLFHCKNLSGIGGVLRPGIVHRLDKDTSGILVVAKNDLAHQELTSQFKHRLTKRSYIALVQGVIKIDTGVIDVPIGRAISNRKKISVKTKRGKKAVTTFMVLERFSGATLLELSLSTGRTHQIRVHLSYRGFPVLGDKTYGGKPRTTELVRGKLTRTLNQVQGKDIDIPRQMLHAECLGFCHPYTKEYLEFTSPLPADMQQVIELLSSH
ncbi:MAG: RluA family pseudouridine synthase [Nitrospirota bacterium]